MGYIRVHRRVDASVSSDLMVICFEAVGALNDKEQKVDNVFG